MHINYEYNKQNLIIKQSIDWCESFRLFNEGRQVVAYGKECAVKDLKVGYGDGPADIFERSCDQVVKVPRNILARFRKNKLVFILLPLAGNPGDEALVDQLGHNARNLSFVHSSGVRKFGGGEAFIASFQLHDKEYMRAFQPVSMHDLAFDLLNTLADERYGDVE